MIQHRITHEVLVGRDASTPARVTMHFLLSRKEARPSLLDRLLGPWWSCSVTFLDHGGEWTQDSLKWRRAKSADAALAAFVRIVEQLRRLDAPPRAKQTALALGLRRMAERIRSEQGTSTRRLRPMESRGNE